MAKGNTGNLLQHFVAIMVVDGIIKQLSEPITIEYIDLFAMKPWEKIDLAEEQFKKRIAAVTSEEFQSNHCVTSGFKKAYQDMYPSGIPPIKRGFFYPNTATLLRYGFPHVNWLMQLHDIDTDKQAELQQMINESDSITGKIHGDHQKSIEKQSEVRKHPIVVMMDPNQITIERPKDKAKIGIRQIIGIVGEHKLNLFDDTQNSPTVLLAFSYADKYPDSVDRKLRQNIEDAGWQGIGIKRLITPANTGRVRNSSHQGWIIHKNLCSTNYPNLQKEWDSWISNETN